MYRVPTQRWAWPTSRHDRACVAKGGETREEPNSSCFVTAKNVPTPPMYFAETQDMESSWTQNASCTSACRDVEAQEGVKHKINAGSSGSKPKTKTDRGASQEPRETIGDRLNEDISHEKVVRYRQNMTLQHVRTLQRRT